MTACESIEPLEQADDSEEVTFQKRLPGNEGVVNDVSLPDHLTDLAWRSAIHLDHQQQERLRSTLTRYADEFSKGDLDLGRTGLVQHHIRTGDALPIKHAPRRIAPARREEMQRSVMEMEAQGVVERSDSPWSSPVVLVTKKDGTKQFCVDYRSLNNVTAKDSYPLPRMDDMLDAMAGAHWFSTLDLKSGYHQFTVMPFGLCNAPSCFERLMERVLEGLQWRTALVYLDDIIVFGGSFDEELERLEEVLRRLRAANLKLIRGAIPGEHVGRDGVKTDPQKVAAVQDWPVPTCVADVKSFVGLCTYYRRFVKQFAQIASPLHQLTRKGARFEWSATCQVAFDILKRALVEAPVLPYPDPASPYLLDTDASAEGLGAVLSQVKDGKECVVAYYSAKFTDPEKNYCVTRKELLAIVKSTKHFHPYLYGAKFLIRTDHAALQWLKTLKAPEGQLARWLGRLEQYHYEVQHRPVASTIMLTA
ncbi:hypothetical protein C7M84_017331 [Penaeus vannamei]|uniref:RNA-directed DNA polymerase n=1 Tax=Penaeus vannamei TaxID=6689 RepID=A0A3R7P9Q7_PENVA|nr:hypothetical protein C7M84_017331 [Penaeus vannamei]